MYGVVIKYKDTTLVRKVELFNKYENALACLKEKSILYSRFGKVVCDVETYYEDNIITMEVLEIGLPTD